jgi:hypothetical protein
MSVTSSSPSYSFARRALPWLAGTVAILAVADIALMSFGHPARRAEPAPAPVLPSLAASDPAIKSLKIDGDTMTVDADLPPVGAAGLRGAEIDVASRVGEAMQKPHADSDARVRQVIFQYRAPVADRLGAATFVPFGRLAFAASDLRAAHYDVLTPSQVYALAHG